MDMANTSTYSDNFGRHSLQIMAGKGNISVLLTVFVKPARTSKRSYLQSASKNSALKVQFQVPRLRWWTEMPRQNRPSSHEKLTTKLPPTQGSQGGANKHRHICLEMGMQLNPCTLSVSGGLTHKYTWHRVLAATLPWLPKTGSRPHSQTTNGRHPIQELPKQSTCQMPESHHLSEQKETEQNGVFSGCGLFSDVRDVRCAPLQESQLSNRALRSRP